MARGPGNLIAIFFFLSDVSKGFDIAIYLFLSFPSVLRPETLETYCNLRDARNATEWERARQYCTVLYAISLIKWIGILLI